MFRSLLSSLIILSVAPAVDAQFGAPSSFGVGTQPEASVIADLIGDGSADLAVTVDAPDRVRIFTGLGNGSFGGAVDVFTGAGTSPHTPIAADLDGDGDTDLAVTLKNVNRIQVLRNDGGSFTLAGSATTAAEPRDLFAADLDGDGDIDLVASCRDGDAISVALNDGAGGMISKSIGVGADPRSVTAGDLDGDGDADIAVSSNDARRVDLLLGDGAGNFASGGNISFGGNLRPEGLAATDVDGDGDLDLVATASGNGLQVLSVMISNGGVFGAPVHAGVNALDPSYVAMADVDLDGDIDAVTANPDSGSLSVMLNTGGSFAFSASIAAGTDSGHVTAGDIDGNGSSDLAATNTDGNSVTVAMNSLAGGPFSNLGGGLAGSFGIPSLTGSGTLAAGTPVAFTIDGALGSAPAAFVVGLSQVNVPFKSGILVPSPDAILEVVTSPGGSVALGGSMPAGFPAGTVLYVQGVIADGAAISGFSLSNALSGTTP